MRNKKKLANAEQKQTENQRNSFPKTSSRKGDRRPSLPSLPNRNFGANLVSPLNTNSSINDKSNEDEVSETSSEGILILFSHSF